MKEVDNTKTVNVYIDTNIKGPRARVGKGVYILEYRPEGREPATLTKVEHIECTENAAHLTILVRALRRLRESCELIIYTDNKYITGNLNRLTGWQQNNWVNAKGKEIANKELWQELLILLDGKKVSIQENGEHQYKKWMRRETGGKEDV